MHSSEACPRAQGVAPAAKHSEPTRAASGLCCQHAISCRTRGRRATGEGISRARARTSIRGASSCQYRAGPTHPAGGGAPGGRRGEGARFKRQRVPEAMRHSPAAAKALGAIHSRAPSRITRIACISCQRYPRTHGVCAVRRRGFDGIANTASRVRPGNTAYQWIVAPRVAPVARRADRSRPKNP
jgi:hypothetical protein